MPNPRPNDLTEQQYQNLRGLFTDAQLSNLSASQMQQLVQPGPAPAVDPDPGMVGAVDPVIRNRGRDIAVRPALARWTSEASRPGGVFDPEAAAIARQQAAAFAAQPFTMGGEQTAGTAISKQQQELSAAMDILGVSPVDVARGTVEPTGLGGVIGAMLPQTIETPEMTHRQKRAREFEAMQQAIEQFAFAGELDLSPIPYDTAMQDHPAVRQRAAQILSGEVSGAPIALAQEGGYQPGTPLQEVRARAAQFAKDWASSALEGAMVREMSMGEPIETPAAQVGRLLAAPTSMAVGAVEAAVTDKPLLTALGERTQQGMGLLGGGMDFGRWSGGAVADVLDLPADSEARENLEKGGAFVGGALGFGGELLVPLDLGAMRLATAAGKVVRRGQAAADLGVDVSQMSRTFVADVGEQYAQLPAARQAAQQLIDIEAAVFGGRGLDEVVEAVAGAGATERSVTRQLQAAGVLDEFESLPAGVKRLNREASSLANRAAVDALTAGSRRQLVEGAALRSGKILSDVARTFSPDDLQRLSPKLREALRVPRSEAPAPSLSGLTTAARESVERQMLLDAADRLLRQRGAAGEEIRRGFSGMVLFEPSAARAADKKLKSTVMGDVAAALARRGRRYQTQDGGINFGLMAEDLNQPNLLEDLAEFLSTGRLLDVNPADLRTIDRGRYHALLMPAVDQWYRAQPGSRPVSAAVGQLERVTEGRDVGRMTAAAAVEGKRLFTPAELRSTGIRKTAMQQMAKLQDETQSFDPTVEVLSKELGDKMGAIDKDYLMKMKRARGEGITGPNTYAAVYWRNYGDTVDTTRGVDDLLSNYYGAFEQMGTALQTTQASSSSFQLAAVMAPQIRQVVQDVLEVLRRSRPEGLEEVADLVVETDRLLLNVATDSSNYLAALVNMRDIAGRLADVDLYDLASMAGVRLPGGVEKYRGALPIFDVARFHDLTGATYLQRRGAAIVDEVFDVNRPEMQALMIPVDAPEILENFARTLTARGIEMERPEMARVLKAIIGDISGAGNSGADNTWEKTRRALNRVGGPKRVVTTFSGGGTVEAALTGARSVGAAEFDPAIVQHFNRAHKTTHKPADATQVNPADVKSAAPDLYHASPVCKNFSKAKRLATCTPQDRASAERVAKIIDEARPPVVTVENVPAYADTALFKLITDALDKNGYKWDTVIHDAADYGANQTRKRVLLRAVREGELPPLPPKEAGADWFKSIEDLIDEAPDSVIPNWEITRIQNMAVRGTIDLKKPILTMGGSAGRSVAAARNPGVPAPTLKASPKEVPRIRLPDGRVKRVTPEMMRRLMGLPDDYPTPEGHRLAKTILGNGIHGEVTRKLIQPLLDRAPVSGRRRPAYTAQDAQEIAAGSQMFQWVNSRLQRLRPEQRPAWDNMARRYLEYTAREKTLEGPAARLQVLGITGSELAQLRGKLGLENFTEMLQLLTRDRRPFFNRFKDWIAEAADGTGKVSLWAKGGMLGGRIAANLRYMGMNALTAPAIIYSTLGARYSAAGMKGWINSDSWQTLKQIVRPGGVAEDRVLFTAPDGRIWTAQDMAELVQTRIRSQGSAELSRRVLDDILAESQIFARDLGVDFDKDKLLHGRQWMKSAIRRGAEKVTGLRVERGREGLGLLPEVTVSMNAFNEIADLTDQGFRIGVAIEALKAGRPVDEAAQLASEALFDYGRMSAVERKTFARAFWFWSFQREALRTVLIQGLENPHRLRASYIASQGMPQDREFHATTKDYLENRPFMALLDRENIQQRWSTYGPAVPMADSLAQVVDTMSVASLLFNGVLHAGLGADLIETGRLDVSSTPMDRTLRQTSDVLTGALQTYAAEAPPPVQLFMGLTWGLDTRREGQKISRYLDPRLVYYMQLNPRVWDQFSTWIEVDGTRPTSDKFGTYRGLQWEIAEDSVDDWYLIQAALLMGGVQRTMKDYAPAVYTALEALNANDPELVPDYRLNPEITDIPAFNQLLYQSGLVTVTDEMTARERFYANQAAMVRTLDRAETR
jgi:site-specific DNA-cytosine methylase